MGVTASIAAVRSSDWATFSVPATGREPAVAKHPSSVWLMSHR